MTVEQIIIIGAGPAGGYLGQLLKREGLDPLILEEDEEIGRPVRCAGVIGRDVWEKLNPAPSRRSILNSLDGARIEYKGREFSLTRLQVAYVVDRAAFDNQLSEGLRVQRGTRVVKISKNGSGYKLETNRGEFRCQFLVGADGPQSIAREFLGFKTPAFLPGVQKRIKLGSKGLDGKLEQAMSTRQVYVKVIKPFSQFGWMVPEGNGVVRVGLISAHPKQDMEQFLKEIIPDGHQVIEEIGGIIPIGLMARSSRGQAALLGDAACQVKPLSGGGIYFGLRCAQVLAGCLKKGSLKDYDKNWKKILGREIRVGLKARQIFDRLSDRSGTELFAVLADHKNLIEEQGDFENHTSAFLKLSRDTRLLKLLGAAFWSFFRK